MRQLFLFLSISVGLIACRTSPEVAVSYVFPTNTPVAVGLTESGLSRVDSLLEAFVAEGKVPFVQAILLREGQLVYQSEKGYTDLAHQHRLPENGIFRMASMTKPVTAVAALILYEEGKFQLDDPIADYLPEFAEMQVMDNFQASDSSFQLVPLARPITIRDLLTHSSGIGYGFIQPAAAIHYLPAGVIDGFTSQQITLQENIRLLAQQPLLHQPGTQWTYGMGLDVIGAMVEKISGQSLADFMTQRIFVPLQMKDSYFHLPTDKEARLVPVLANADSGHFQTMAMIAPEMKDTFDFPIRGAKTYFAGGGGLCMTADNYARFAQMLTNGGELNGVRILQDSTARRMAGNNLNPAQFGENRYGLGVTSGLAAADALFPDRPGAFGWGGYFKTRYWSDPSEAYTGIILCQMPNEAPYAGQLLDLFQKMAYEAITRPAKVPVP